MDLFADILKPLSTPTPIGAVVDRVVRSIVSSHHPATTLASRIPQTSRLGLPPIRQNPWQRISRSFAPTSDAMEALHRSGLQWTAEKIGLRTHDLAPIADHVAIRRSDTGRVLGIVGSDYQPLQNAEAFAFFRDLAGTAPISFETAGAFDHGGITWVQAKLPDLSIRLGDDISESYLFISNGHIGNKPLTIAPTTLRIVCRNSLRMAEAQSANARQRRQSLEAGFTVRHTKGMKEALSDIRDAYAQTVRSHAATTQAYQHLASKRITTKLTDHFISRVFDAGIGPDEADRARTIRENRRERIAAILASPTAQVRGTANSAFALFQAAIEFIDHDRVTRTAEGEDATEKRLVSATFGSGAGLKSAAWEAILDLTKA